MPTPVSAVPNTYCTPADFVQRYDVRSVGDRLQDAGVRVSSASVLTDPNLQSLLNQASGMFESAVLRGQKYQVSDLQALMTASPAQVGADFIRGLISDLTLWLIYNRRPDPTRPVPEQCKLALQTLDALAQGLRIFPLQETMNAGYQQPILSPDNSIPARPLLPVTTSAQRLFGNH